MLSLQGRGRSAGRSPATGAVFLAIRLKIVPKLKCLHSGCTSYLLTALPAINEQATTGHTKSGHLGLTCHVRPVRADAMQSLLQIRRSSHHGTFNPGHLLFVNFFLDPKYLPLLELMGPRCSLADVAKVRDLFKLCPTAVHGVQVSCLRVDTHLKCAPDQQLTEVPVWKPCDWLPFF